MKSAGLKTKRLRIPAGLLVTHHRISSSNPSTEIATSMAAVRYDR